MDNNKDCKTITFGTLVSYQACGRGMRMFESACRQLGFNMHEDVPVLRLIEILHEENRYHDSDTFDNIFWVLSRHHDRRQIVAMLFEIIQTLRSQSNKFDTSREQDYALGCIEYYVNTGKMFDEQLRLFIIEMERVNFDNQRFNSLLNPDYRLKFTIIGILKFMCCQKPYSDVATLFEHLVHLSDAMVLDFNFKQYLKEKYSCNQISKFPPSNTKDYVVKKFTGL